jgi:hypothetical protein
LRWETLGGDACSDGIQAEQDQIDCEHRRT